MRTGTPPLEILAIRFGSLGDVVLCLPALQYLKSVLPDARITFLTHRAWTALLEFAPAIDTVVGWEGMGSLASPSVPVLCPGGADLVLDFQASPRSWLVQQSVGGVSATSDLHRWSRRRLLRSGLWQWFPPPRIHPNPVWRQQLSTTQSGLQRLMRAGRLSEVVLEPWELWQPPAAALRLKQADLKEHRASQVCIAPGSRHLAKRLPIERIITMVHAIQAHGASICLVGSPQERSLLEEIASTCPGVRLAFESWTEVLVALKESRVLLSPDSGLVHVAEALGVPAVVLFGPTVPAFGFAPRLTQSRMLEVPLACRPCHLHGGAACPRGHHRCLMDISVEAMVASMDDCMQTLSPMVLQTEV